MILMVKTMVSGSNFPLNQSIHSLDSTIHRSQVQFMMDTVSKLVAASQVTDLLVRSEKLSWKWMKDPIH